VAALNVRERLDEALGFLNSGIDHRGIFVGVGRVSKCNRRKGPEDDDQQLPRHCPRLGGHEVQRESHQSRNLPSWRARVT
jgi:hypothetical protein